MFHPLYQNKNLGLIFNFEHILFIVHTFYPYIFYKKEKRKT